MRTPIDTLTPARRRVLRAVKALIRRDGYSPSLRQLARRTRMSAQGVASHVATLVRLGYVEHERGIPRSICIVDRAKRRGA